PTDSGRCADAIRVVSRALRGPCPGCRPTGPPRIVCNAMTLGFALRALLSLGLALCLAALLAMMLYFGWDDYRLGDHDYQHDLQEQRLLAFHTRLARIMIASLFMFPGAALVLGPLSRYPGDHTPPDTRARDPPHGGRRGRGYARARRRATCSCRCEGSQRTHGHSVAHTNIAGENCTTRHASP